MNAELAAVIILLSLGVGIQLLCSIGILIMPGAYAQLHYQGPASSLGALLIAVAVVVQDGFAQSSIKAVMIALVLLISSPIVSHATARAAKTRDDAGWDADDSGET